MSEFWLSEITVDSRYYEYAESESLLMMVPSTACHYGRLLEQIRGGHKKSTRRLREIGETDRVPPRDAREECLTYNNPYSSLPDVFKQTSMVDSMARNKKVIQKKKGGVELSLIGSGAGLPNYR